MKKVGNVVVADLRNAFYKSGDPRRRKEYEDSHLVAYDHTAVANLPEHGYQTYFPGRPWIPNSYE